MSRVVIGWSYDNTRLYCQLREWSFRDTRIISIGYYQALRAIRNTEVWLIGPEWHYQPNDLAEIFDVLDLQGLTYKYGETDWLLDVNRER